MNAHIGIRFTIGKAFPAADPLARWVTICVMALNDLLYANRLLVPRLEGTVPSEDYENVYLARVAGAHLYEAAKFLGLAHRRIAAIDAFVAELPPGAKVAYEKVKAVGPSGSSAFAQHLKQARGHVFHYSELLPHAEEHEALKAAMERQAQAIGEIRDESPPITGFRARFADDIAVELTLGSQPLDDREYVAQLSEHIAAYLEFASAAIGSYIQHLPHGALEYIVSETGSDQDAESDPS